MERGYGPIEMAELTEPDWQARPASQIRGRFEWGDEILSPSLVAQVRAGDHSFTCDLRPGARDSLLNGAWDPLDELLEANHAIESIHGNLAYT